MARDGLRHKRGCFSTVAHETGVMREGGCDARCTRVEQQLRGVEAVSLRGRPRPLRAQTVMHALLQAGHETEMHVAQPRGERMPRHLRPVLEERDKDARGMARDHADMGAVCGERDAGRTGLRVQVITVGAARPVYCSICASERDSAIRGASASCVSTAWRLASGS